MSVQEQTENARTAAAQPTSGDCDESRSSRCTGCSFASVTVLTPRLSAVLASLVLVAAAQCTSEAAAASLRVASINAYQPSPAFYHKLFFSVKLEPFSGGKSETEIHKDMAHKVAAKVCNDAFDYDVVAFSEVWWEAARDIITDDLKACSKGAFPYTVGTLGADLTLSFDGVKGEDSGLTIFSRYPLKSMPAGPFTTKA